MPRFGHEFAITKDVTPDGKQVLTIPGPVPLFFRVMLNPAELHRVMRLKKLADRVKQVELAVGPIDSILGHYNFKFDEIEIDGLESFLIAAMKNPDLDEVDRAITEVTAHEARHAWQERRFGNWGRADRPFIRVALIILAWWFAIWPLAHNGFELLLSGRPLALLGLPMMFAGFMVWNASLMLSSFAAYRLSWAERDARAFAKKAMDDPDWKNVIEVDLGVFVPTDATEPPTA